MIAKELKRAVTQLLEDDFSALEFETSPESDCFVTIKPAWKDFGLIELCEEDGQLVVNWGRFTHSHIDSYNDDSDERVAEVVEGLRHLLGNVVADRVAFWGQAHDGSGGFFFVDGRASLHGRQRAHLWSGATLRCSDKVKSLGDGVQGEKVIPLPDLDVEWMRAEIEKRWLDPIAGADRKPWWKFW